MNRLAGFLWNWIDLIAVIGKRHEFLGDVRDRTLVVSHFSGCLALQELLQFSGEEKRAGHANDRISRRAIMS